MELSIVAYLFENMLWKNINNSNNVCNFHRLLFYKLEWKTTRILNSMFVYLFILYLSMKLLVIAYLLANSSWKDTNKTLQVFSIINFIFVNEIVSNC